MENAKLAATLCGLVLCALFLGWVAIMVLG